MPINCVLTYIDKILDVTKGSQFCKEIRMFEVAVTLYYLCLSSG